METLKMWVCFYCHQTEEGNSLASILQQFRSDTGYSGADAPIIAQLSRMGLLTESGTRLAYIGVSE